MKTYEVLNCSFSSWYAHFKNITWKSIILPLQQDFVQYLKADGLVLPEGPERHSTNISHNSDDSDDDIDWNDDNSQSEIVCPKFPELNVEICEAIAELGGSVFPKLNWSSAKDATWISLNNSLKCTCPGDVYLLLKSSQFITHDLTQPFKDCEDASEENMDNIHYELILRKWNDVNPSMEFRCFVRDNELIALSQRDYTNFYPHVKLQEDDIIEDIISFFDDEICEKFPDNQYVFDVYRERKNHVKLIDFNPFGTTTDALLFEWEELLSDSWTVNNELPVFRYVKNETGVQPNPYRYYAMPLDFAQLSTGEDPYKLIDVLKMVQGETEGNLSDEDIN